MRRFRKFTIRSWLCCAALCKTRTASVGDLFFLLAKQFAIRSIFEIQRVAGRAYDGFVSTARIILSLDIEVEHVMSDNGSSYKSFAFRRACKRLGLKHIRTRP